MVDQRITQRRFENNVVMVVGAGAPSGGVSNGLAAAVLYAREGARVFAIDAQASHAETTREIVCSEGGEIDVAIADISEQGGVQDAVAQCLERFGTIDVLHNNVGIIKQGGPNAITLQDWHRLLDVNLSGIFMVCREVLPVMETAGGGAIVNISSVSGIKVSTSPHIAYAASKAGLMQMAKEIAVEYGPKGIRVNNILPGGIESAVARKHWAEMRGVLSPKEVNSMLERQKEAIPMRRLGTPWEVAKAALFLASDEASFITGADLIVDGGLTCL